MEGGVIKENDISSVRVTSEDRDASSGFVIDVIRQMRNNIVGIWNTFLGNRRTKR